MSAAREQIIEKTCSLLEEQGYHATGLNQIIRESGAPKGSLYYYFPQGKEELAAEAITRTGRLIVERVRSNLVDVADITTAVHDFVLRIAGHVESAGYRAGGPLTAVAMETATSNDRLNAACREAFSLLEAAFAERLAAGGLSAGRSTQLATFITASIEGGIILSRTYHSRAPLERVAAELQCLLVGESE